MAGTERGERCSSFLGRLSPEKGYLLTTSLVSLRIHLIGPYLTLWLKELRFSFTQIGFLQSLSSFVALVADFPTGGLADRYGRRLNYAIGVLLFSIPAIVVALTANFYLIALAFAVSGLGEAFMSGSLSSWLYDALGRDARKAYSVFGRRRMLDGVIGALAGFVAGTLAHYALNLPLLVAGICGVVASLATLLLLEENYGYGRAKHYLEVLGEGLKHIRRCRQLHFLLTAMLLASFGSRAFFMFWMVLARQAGLSESSVGPVYTLLLLSMGLGGFLAHRIADHRRTVTISTLVAGLLLVGMGVVESLPVLLTLLILYEVILGIRTPALTTLLNELIPSRIRSTTISALSTLTSIFTTTANIAIGLLADVLGLKTAYLIAGILTIAATLPTVLAAYSTYKAA